MFRVRNLVNTTTTTAKSSPPLPSKYPSKHELVLAQGELKVFAPPAKFRLPSLGPATMGVVSGAVLALCVVVEGLPAHRHFSTLEPTEHTVAWLTQQQASARATVSFIASQVAPRQPKVALKAEAPAKAGANVCLAPNKEMQTDDGCAILCEKNMTDPNDHAKFKQLETADPRMLCDPDFCKCFDPATPKEQFIKHVQVVEQIHVSGLPECDWMPSEDCTTESQYECMAGPKKGKCSGKNWIDKTGECTSSCIHAKLYWYAPHDKKWIPAPDAKAAKALADKGEGETDSEPAGGKDDVKPGEVPHYDHDKEKMSLESRHINLKDLDVMMSPACKHNQPFVAVTLYSPKYAGKAKRLLKSCERNNVCCKATEAPGSVAHVKEGSSDQDEADQYRLEMIRMKPAFILAQMDAIQLPVVWLDCDMEFHKFPKKFMPASWETGPRDALLFNFWGNETKGQDSPSIGSGVAFFNYTLPARNLLVAWAEAMAYDLNAEAPDDQVLSELLGSGSWVRRAKFGWLPASYMRHLPAMYRGVDPVIDHDHGSVPGLNGHSDVLPNLPPVKVPEKPKELPKWAVACTASFPASPEWCAEKCPPPGACKEKLCACTVSAIKRKVPFAPCDQVLRSDGSCAGDDALAPGHFVSPTGQ